MPPRPGVNPLRFTITNVVTRDGMDALRRVARELGPRPPDQNDRLTFGGR